MCIYIYIYIYNKYNEVARGGDIGQHWPRKPAAAHAGCLITDGIGIPDPN